MWKSFHLSKTSKQHWSASRFSAALFKPQIIPVLEASYDTKRLPSSSCYRMLNPVLIKVIGCARRIWCRSCSYKTILKILIFLNLLNAEHVWDRYVNVFTYNSTVVYCVQQIYRESWTEVCIFFAESTQNICYRSDLAIFGFDSEPLRSLRILLWIRIYSILLPFV